MPSISSPSPWKPPPRTPWQNFRREPATFIALWLYSHRPTLIDSTRRAEAHAPGRSSHKIRVVCISDTHNTKPAVPDGDILLHAGDLSNKGTFEEIQAQLSWLASLPHRHKVVIAGNHDRLLDAEFVRDHPERIAESPGSSRADLNWHDVVYLENSVASLTFPASTANRNSTSEQKLASIYLSEDLRENRTLKIYGSPQTPLCGTFAFQYPPIRDVWSGKTPSDVDIFLIHGPPKGYLDQPAADVDHKGCPRLTRVLERVRPRLVVFGHIHSGHGRQDVKWSWSVERVYVRMMGVGEGDSLSTAMKWWIVVLMLFGLIGAWGDVIIGRVLKSRRQEYERRRNTTVILNAAIGAEAGDDRAAMVIDV